VTGKTIALDTNVAIAVLNNTGDIRGWVAPYETVCLPVPVVGELLFGARNSRRPDENCDRVRTLVSSCRILAADLATAETYSCVRRQLKQAGTPIPENDVWIAALCVQNALPLATSDEHFERVDGLEIVKR